MKILLTGANGYIGSRLLPALVEAGHHVVAIVRNPKRLFIHDNCKGHVDVYEGNLLDRESLNDLPEDIDAAYYLVHSMTGTGKGFYDLEAQCAENFTDALKRTNTKQIVFLSGICHNQCPSEHLSSRKNVERIIQGSGIPFTILQAGIIIGSGSASFTIIRDLVEKLPVMVTPKWVNNRTQPISIFDVIHYLKEVLHHKECLNKTFEIGGDDVLTYKELLGRFAIIRGLKRYIINVPVLTPRLSSYWLYFVTSANFSLAKHLVDSLKCDVVCQENSIREIIPKKMIPFEEAVSRAFAKIEESAVISSWKEAYGVEDIDPKLWDFVHAPSDGCYVERYEFPFTKDYDAVVDSLWEIGGKNGWYYFDFAWRIRGWIDKLFGGVGLNRGRRDPKDLRRGDVLDFWRVLLADKEHGRFLLFAEMKTPGEAWLEIEVKKNTEGEGGTLIQTATFRPHGLMGRLYWISIYPVHILIFKGLGPSIIKRAKVK